MTNRILMLTFVFASNIMSQLFIAAFVRAEPSARPNILLIITDDQGYGDLSLHGNPHVSTPHLDRLGQGGVQFERFYVNSFCAPTRAAVLTGRWPLRCGVHGVTHNKEAMRPEEVTIAEILQAAGYRTACIGKWHNGEQFPYIPGGQGFETVFGFNNGHWNNYFDATLLRGTTPEQTKGYISDVLTDEAIRFIQADRQEPFFCYLSLNAPHSPYQVPDKYYDKFRAAGFDESVSGFYGMVENIDDNAGRLLQELQQTGKAENTIVLFLTDNGGTAGVKIYNAGMRGGKTSVHEGGSRVPLFMQWPAANWQPHVAKPITSHIDLLPTLADLCGVNVPDDLKIDGVSLRPLLEQDRTEWPERTLFTHNPISETNRYPGAVRTEQYRLVKEIKGPAGGSSAKPNDQSAIGWQLYDMWADPGQTNNIAAQQPDLVQKLAAEYEAWIDDISHPIPERPVIPIGYNEHNPVELHAPQAYFDEPLQFANGPGFANDWLTGWTKAGTSIWFEIEVVTPGTYRAEIDYSCPEESAGANVSIIVGQSHTNKLIPAAPPQAVILPHRDEKGKLRYRNRNWATLSLGLIELHAQDRRITLSAESCPGREVMDFKHLKLTRISH